ncbi:glycosyltransferase family 4 protein [Clostridium sp. YIM B02515]|uniref:Glycosyltransferase family 4 protein n=1 Tax=Clostridium rhizosphaerae TaxID=2803861 RepID=A0ABS1TAI8_9CLOT|nr:glycosyltransferase family 4 protein [Clostridium rhizosphaerae]MBL4936340.1 glycosyltransferase family 4 protein [Clostridium rhizosphaerae]
MKKKLLIYAHYFYPDVASTGQLITELSTELQNDFEITVICVVPSYNGKVEEFYRRKRIFEEKYQNIKLIRVRVPEFDKKNKISRIKNIVTYFFNAIYATFKIDRQDVIFSISQPPILGGISGFIGKLINHAKFIYNIQDFNPEQSEAVSYAKSKLLLSIAKMLDKFSCSHSDMIVIVGRDMQQTLNKRFENKKVPSNIVINNWIDEKEIYPLPDKNEFVTQFREKYGLGDKFVFMYSGNIGLYYDLENIIKVIGRFKDKENVIFAFIGDGTLKQTLVNYVKENHIANIRFIPYQDKNDLIYSLNAADIHIVTNAKGIKGISVPSKIYGVMASGKPVLGILENDSEARNIIEEANCGICCEPGDYKAIYETINYFINSDINEIKEVGNNGRKLIESNYNKSNSIHKYRKLIDNLG